MGFNKIRHLKKRQRAFLSAYSRTASVTRAAEAAKISRLLHYYWIKTDEKYAVAFRQAEDLAADFIETEAIRRACHGYEEPVIYKGQLMGQWVDPDGQPCDADEPDAKYVPLTVRKYSDKLLAQLLLGAKPEKYKIRQDVKHAGSMGIEHSGGVSIYIPDNGRQDRDQAPAGTAGEVAEQSG